jgi:hypothetical protein
MIPKENESVDEYVKRLLPELIYRYVEQETKYLKKEYYRFGKAYLIDDGVDMEIKKEVKEKVEKIYQNQTQKLN